MKKHFTFGIFLFLLLGIGSNVEATTFTSRLSAITGVPTSTQTTSSNVGLRIGAWNAKSTWYDPAVVDTNTVSNPSVTDDVTISAGDSVYVNVASYCKTLNVTGVVCTNNGILNVNGDATVGSKGSSIGILSVIKQVYCKNIYNYGKTWASGKTNSSTTTTVALYVGYTCTGATATASTDSCTILNDGIIGWYRSPSFATTNTPKGSGLFVYYPNIAKAVNITHSAGVNSGYVFTTLGIQPVFTSAIAQSQDFNLYINESVALVTASSSIVFSLYNTTETLASTYKRTCTIASGDTMFIAGYLKNTTPTVAQGPIFYNIYGCLDMGSYRQTKNEFDIFTSATLSSPVTINIGDGTQANAGTLVFGLTTTLSGGAANQIIFNQRQYSTVKFGYKSAPVITCTVGGTADNTVFPNSFYNLIVSNTGGVTLPSSININVSNALTLSLGNLTLGTTNLTAGSILGGSATSYIVTNGTGTLTQTAAIAGTLFPIGTATSYAPVTIAPASNDLVSASVSAATTGSYTGYAINANEWTLTPQVATTATLAFTPTTASNTTSPVIFSGSGYAAKADATLTGSTYSASGFSLGTTATIFATGGTTPQTALKSTTNNDLLVYADNNSLVVKNAKVGDVVSVYGVSGLKVASSVVKGENTTMTLKSGIYIVKTDSIVQKVIVQ
jgi:hypothetical protein